MPPNLPSPFQFQRSKRTLADFTDREEPIRAFDAALSKLVHDKKCAADRAKVIQFYGVGGIGKSRLLKQLEARLTAHFPDALLASVDFDDESVRTPARALLRLRKTARSNRRIDFRHFDFAYAVYFARRNPDFTFEKRKLPFLEEGGVIGNVLSAFQGLGIASAVTGVLSQTHRLLDYLSIAGVGRDALIDLRILSERQIEEALPDFLAFDLAKDSEGHSPVVLFVDTYETLWDSHTSERSIFSRDAWLRRLCRNLPNALVVIAGRESIRWDEFEDAWHDSIAHCSLDRLGQNDSLQLLTSAGISDRNLAEQMIRLSDGHPYYLDLCIDAFLEGSAHGFDKRVAKWPETKRELFERFTRSLVDEELALLRCVAPLPSYDIDYARAAARFFSIPLTEERLQAHLRFSFIKLEHGVAIMHEIMRRTILFHTNSEQMVRIRRFAMDYFSTKIESMPINASDEMFAHPLRATARLVSDLNDSKLADSWLSGPAKRAIQTLQLRAVTEPILTTLETIRNTRSPAHWPNELRIAFADITHIVGQNRRGVSLLDECLNHHSLDEILADDDLSFALVRRLHHRMTFEPITDLWEECQNLIPFLSLRGRKLALFEGYFLLGGNLGATRGNRVAAAPWLAKAIRFARAESNSYFLVRTLRKSSDFARMAGRIEHAGTAVRRGLALARACGARRYTLYLRCAEADVVRLMEQTEKAAGSFRAVREEFASSNMEGWIGHTYLGEAACAEDKGEWEAACSMLDAAERYYRRANHEWGMFQVDFHRLRVLMAIAHDVVASKTSALIERGKYLGYERDSRIISELISHTSSKCPAIAFL